MRIGIPITLFKIIVTKGEVISTLINYNRWRLGAEIEMLKPETVTTAIAIAIEILQEPNL